MHRQLFVAVGVFLFFFHLAASAAPVSLEKAGRAGKMVAALRQHSDRPSKAASAEITKPQKQIRFLAPLQKENITLGYIVHLEPQGYILMTADDLAPPVKLYSEDSSFDQLPPGFRAVIELEMQEDLARLAQMPGQDTEYHQQWNTLLETEDPNTAQTAGSNTVLLTTAWNQASPYNYYCPAVTSGGSGGLAYAGCGATAMAQILRYHTSPLAATQDHTYTDYSGSYTGTYSISTVGMDHYDWTNMPISISSSSPSAQIQAVSRLIYHCAVALESDFEAAGTSSSSSDIAPAFRNYFNCTCDNYVNKSSYTESAWYNKIAADIDASKPVFYTMWSADNTNGHAVVCDGYRNGNEIHLNLGWSGSGTAWYTMSSITYSSYTWTIHGGVFNITPTTYGSLYVTLGPEGSLDGGAQWRRVGTAAWYNSGDTETGIATGTYSVEFKSVVGWIAPENTAVTITKNQTTELSADYTSSPLMIIGNGTSTDYYPLATSRNTARTQSIYLAGEIGGPCSLYSLALNVATAPGQTMNNFTIRMKHTDLNTYSTKSWETADWTTVYQTDQAITATGWTEFAFTSPFEYNGIQNLMVDISFNNSSSSTHGYCYYSAPGGNRTLRYRTTNSTTGDPLMWAGESPMPGLSNYVPNIRLSIASKSPDLTANGFVDMDDFLWFSAWWQSRCDVSNHWCDGADLDWSGRADLPDLDIFISAWLNNP
ncbi:MAG: C10 family peptidase [Anaerohalosphaeraceae bacterium]